MYFLLLLILPGVRNQENLQVNQVEPRAYHPFRPVQFVPAKPTKKGPILFPNDAPPPPPTPLIVTSRPLSESIARSELNPNNSLAAQSQYHQVSYKPEYLSRVKDYKPYAYSVATATPVYELGGYNADTVSTVQGSRKENFYHDYEKLSSGLNARKTLLFDDDDAKSTQLKVFHGSLYSREAEYYDHDKQMKTEDIAANFRRSNRGEKKIEKRITYDKSKTPHDYSSKSNRKHFHKVKYSSDDTTEDVKKRHVYSINEYNRNKKAKIISTTGYLLNDNDYLKDRPHIRENYSGDSDRHDHGRHVPIIKTTTKTFTRHIEKLPKLPHGIETLSGDEDRVIVKRPYYSLENDGHKHQNPLKGGATYRLDSSSEKDEKVSKKNRAWHYNFSDRDELVFHKRPAHSIEDRNDDLDRIVNLHPRSAEKKYVQAKKPEPIESLEHVDSIFSKRPSKNVDLDKRYSKKAEKKSTPRSVEDDSDNFGRMIEKRPSYNVDSDEPTKHRVVQPLYSLGNHGHREQQVPAKPTRFKYQQRFKTRNRFDSPRARAPTGDHYYPTRDGEHDTSKEFNHGENYAFSYTVKDHKTGDDFSHSQQSTGSATNGEYRVRLPDGRMQIVSYTADENGYKADVRYDGDEHHQQDNSIDVDTSRENRYRNDEPIYKHDANDAHTYNYRLGNQDISDSEYLQHRLKDDKPEYIKDYSRPTLYSSHRPDDFLDHANDFHNQPKNEFAYKNAYNADTTKFHVEDKSGAITDNNNDYLEHYNDKNESQDNLARTRDDDYFLDEIMDYSSELGQGYQPHKSKFSSFDNRQNVKPSVRPSYEELRDLFDPSRRQNQPIVSTVRPNYDVTPSVVIITSKKPNLYTNIKNIVPVTPSPVPYSTPSAVSVTPSSYLVSTIANLKHQINLANKPVLSHQYIDKINKYLTYK